MLYWKMFVRSESIPEAEAAERGDVVEHGDARRAVLDPDAAIAAVVADVVLHQ